GRPQHDVTNWTSFSVTPGPVGKHEYLPELIDRDSGGTGAPNVIASHLATLQASAPPRIDDFTANRAHVCAGNSSGLTWATSFATTVTLTSWGDVPLSGSRLVTPTGTTTYTLDAVNELGHPPLDPATVTVTTTPRPVVNFFRADPSPVAEATPTTL